MKWVNTFLPDLDTPEEKVKELAMKVYKLGSVVFGVKAVDAFIPHSAVDQDARLWEGRNGITEQG
jgi:hypothetical protein